MGVDSQEHEAAKSVEGGRADDIFVWAPAGGFPAAHQQKVNSPAFTLRDGSYFWVTYNPETRYECNSLSFHLPKWRPQISGRVLAIAQGFPKKFNLTGDGINFGCANGVTNVTFIVDDNSSQVKMDNEPRAYEDSFVWAPAGGFPAAYQQKVNSPAFTLRDGSHFRVTYYPETTYGCNQLYFEFPKWAPLDGRVIVFDRRFPKEFNLTDGGSISLSCAKQVSNVTIMVSMRNRPPPEHLLLRGKLVQYVTSLGESGFVWQPTEGFGGKGGASSETARLMLQDGSYFIALYKAENSYGCNSLSFKAPKYRNFTGLVEVVSWGFPKIFNITSPSGINFGCAEEISKITMQIDPSGNTSWSDIAWQSSEYFVWQPTMGFPFEGSTELLSEPFVPLRSSNSTTLRLRYRPGNGYGCNTFSLVDQSSTGRAFNSTVVVVAQGYPKKFELSGGAWTLSLCAEDVSKVAVRLSP